MELNTVDTVNTVNSTNFHQTLRDFTDNCRVDKRLTPNTQLVYRVLLDLANRAYWAYPFETSEAELKAITHIISNETITECKRTLKNLGYIDFHGKPSRYTIYTPPVKRAVKRAVNSAAPRTPRFNTTNTKNTIHKSIPENTVERRDARDDRDAANASNDNVQPATSTNTTVGNTAESKAEALRRLRAKHGL